MIRTHEGHSWRANSRVTCCADCFPQWLDCIIKPIGANRAPLLDDVAFQLFVIAPIEVDESIFRSGILNQCASISRALPRADCVRRCTSDKILIAHDHAVRESNSVASFHVQQLVQAYQNIRVRSVDLVKAIQRPVLHCNSKNRRIIATIKRRAVACQFST